MTGGWVVKGWWEVHVVFPGGRASRSELSCELQTVLINVKVALLRTSQNVLLASSQGRVTSQAAAVTEDALMSVTPIRR